VIGGMQQSLFKMPGDQLVIGFITKKKASASGDCLSQFMDEDEEDIQADLEVVKQLCYYLKDLLDNEGEQLVGTIKFIVSYIGYNDSMFTSKKWIN
jgi:hypothetical protein